MASYDQQQKEFSDMIRAAKRELAAARSAVQELNQQAGRVSAVDSDREEPGSKDAETVVKEEAALRDQINGLLTQCVQGAATVSKAEVDDVEIQAISDSDDDQRPTKAKRARSEEARAVVTPTDGPAEGVGG